MNPYDYANLPEDELDEKSIIRWLHSVDQHQRFTFIWRVIRENPGHGISLVPKAQLNPVYLEVILEFGFVYGDASTVRWWYEATVEELGHKKIIEMLRKHLDDAPLVLDKMLYWLRPEDEVCKVQAALLRQEFANKYPGFSSGRSTGIHATKA